MEALRVFRRADRQPYGPERAAGIWRLRGFLCGHGCRVAGDYPGRRPLRTEPDFVEAVKACGVNALISSGLRFRTDLTAFGGPGLAHALDLLKHAGVSTENVWANALSFLSFPWVAPAKPEKVTRQIECHWCGTRKMEGEHFSKMGFDYCSPSCIAKHRRAEFDPTKVRSYQG
ncbi:unnamed protein product [Effrenium voratum]|nr:unnamed protein product [Effrenium voratum]